MKVLNKKNVMTVAVIFSVLGLIGPTVVSAAATPSLGAAESYGILAGTYTNASAATTITGDIGFTTAPAQDPLGVHLNYGAGAPTPTARIDAASALATGLATQACTFTFPDTDIDLATDISHGPVGVYTPGVYCTRATRAASIGTGGITLNGAGTYIFRIDGALTSVDNSIVTLAPGTSACDVFWTPTAATTLGANTTFVGTIVDNATAITIGDNTTWSGRALSLGAGTVTTGDTVTIIAPTCVAATLHVIKLVVNGSGGTAIPANFSVYVKQAGLDVAGSPFAGASAPGTSYSLSGGEYTVSEAANASYVRSFSGDCDANGVVNLASGDDKTCTIINTDIPLPAPVSSNGGMIPPVVPLIGILKVPSPLALPNGPGTVTYDYTVWNVGKQRALVNVTVVDDKCGPVTLVSGDLNKNFKIEADEIWKYSCATNLAKTTTNTAVATGYSDDAYHQSAIATAIATVAVGTTLTPPLINIVKVPSRLTAFPYGGGDVTYTYTVTNKGVVAMNNVTVGDDKCTAISTPAGDVNSNKLLETTETWVYTCRMNIPVSTRNVATAKGEANGFVAIGYAFANVLVSAPVKTATSTATTTPGFPKAGGIFGEQGNARNIVLIFGLLVIASTSLVVVMKKSRS